MSPYGAFGALRRPEAWINGFGHFGAIVFLGTDLHSLGSSKTDACVAGYWELMGPPIGLIEVEVETDVAVVRLLGEHDLSSAGQLSERLELLAREGLRLAVDLTETEFLDLAVVRALLNAADHFGGSPPVLQVAPGTIAERLLAAGGLTDWFTITHDRASALAAIRSKR